MTKRYGRRHLRIGGWKVGSNDGQLSPDPSTREHQLGGIAAANKRRDLPTMAPHIGEIRTDFLTRLDPNPFRLPTTVADAGSIGSFWLAAASVTGLSHANDALTGQDSYAFALGPSNALSVVVADGLGSKPRHSQLGAVALSRALAHRLASIDGPEQTEAIREAVVGASQSVVSTLGRELPTVEASEYATVFAAVWLPPAPQQRAVAIRVGDASVYRLKRGEFIPIFETGEGPLNRVGAALPSEEPVIELARFSMNDADAVVLVTDGVDDDIHGSPGVREWLSDAWSEPCTSARMIDSLRFRRRGSIDDKTAAVVWLEPRRLGEEAR